MSTIQVLHEFCGQMTYGNDLGFTQIWLTRSMYERLLLEMRGVRMYPQEADFLTNVVNWEMPVLDRKEPPPYIEFEGRRIYCDE